LATLGLFVARVDLWFTLLGEEAAAEQLLDETLFPYLIEYFLLKNRMIFRAAHNSPDHV